MYIFMYFYEFVKKLYYKIKKKYSNVTRGVTGKFFWGGRVIFPDFFPGVKCPLAPPACYATERDV